MNKQWTTQIKKKYVLRYTIDSKDVKENNDLIVMLIAVQKLWYVQSLMTHVYCI